MKAGARLTSKLRSLRGLSWSSASKRRLLNLAGSVALGVAFVCVNILSSRFFERWDVTSAQLYSLSDVTLETLDRLEQPVEVVVFLSGSDPLSHSVRTLLDAYRARAPLVRPRFVDPDRHPAEFVALQRQYGIFEGKTQNGRLATEASIVVVHADQRWFITTDDILVFDDEDGQAKPRLEQALTEGLVNVLGRQQVTVCLTTGHREIDPDDGGPESLSQFRLTLEQNNYELRTVDLSTAEGSETLAGCRLVVVAGPSLPFTRDAAERLRRHSDDGGSLFLLVGPLTDDEGRIRDPGLGPLLEPLGIEYGNDLIFEGDPKLRLPVGIGGEVFLASPKPHATTDGFIKRGEVRDRVLFQLSQSLTLARTGTAKPLLVTSEQAITVDGFRALQSQERWAQEQSEPERKVVAAAWERVNGKDAAHPARVIVAGSESLLWSSTFLDPTLLSTRRFVENAISWLAAQPRLVSVPEKPSHPAGLNLTDAALEEVKRYVLLYMPICVALLGTLIALRRRKELAASE